MKYKDPNKILSPQDAVENLQVIYDGGDSSVSIAKIKWYEKEKKVTGIRWNIGMREQNDIDKKNGKECVGFPSSRGYPTWFILPDDFLNKKSELWKKIDEIKEQKTTANNKVTSKKVAKEVSSVLKSKSTRKPSKPAIRSVLAPKNSKKKK